MKAYLGDGVYADMEYDSIVLTTEDGTSVTNRIVLEPQVYALLVEYAGRMTRRWARRQAAE